MSTILERKVAALERRIAPPAPAPRYVITISEFTKLSPFEKVGIYRQMIRGEVALETGRDRKPVHVPDKATLERMSPDELVATYRAALAEALER